RASPPRCCREKESECSANCNWPRRRNAFDSSKPVEPHGVFCSCMTPIADSLALVLTGGGARGAYQVGVLRCLARHLPKNAFDIITGVSAGAINAAFVASRNAPLADVIDELSEVWRTLELKDVIRI